MVAVDRYQVALSPSYYEERELRTRVDFGIVTVQGPCVCPPCDVTPETCGNALILWPLRFTSATLGLRLKTGATTETVNLSVTVGRNYWVAGDSQADVDGGVGGVGDFLTRLQTALNTNTGGGTYAVTLTTGFRLHIAVTGVSSFELLMSHAATSTQLLEPMGFGSATYVSSAGAIDSVYLPRGIWRPNKPFATDTRMREPTIGGIASALSGLSRVSSLIDNPRKERTISFVRVIQQRSLREYQYGDEPTGSFEYAWVYSIKLGRPLRLYPDEATRTSTSYTLHRIASLADPLMRAPSSESNTRWNIGPLELRQVS